MPVLIASVSGKASVNAYATALKSHIGDRSGFIFSKFLIHLKEENVNAVGEPSDRRQLWGASAAGGGV